MNKKWEFYEENNEKIIEIAKKHNISELLTKILVNRGITDDKEIDTFLNPTRNDFYDPYLMPDMEKAVERIIKAINNQEKVMIYGDYDVDGITSITVLKKFLEERGLKTGHYIPNRLEEGYGLNENAIRSIAEQKYTLMITVDCGISGIEEVDLANQLGIETIITDHHEQLENLPNAYAIINAKRKDSQYPFRGLAGCGAVFKLIQAISIRLKLEEKEFLKYLDIVCVGTISDIVPLVDENRVIAKLGLKLVAQTRNIGLRELILQSGYKKVDSNTISFGVAPRINACGRMGYQEEALDLFLTNNIEEAKKITARLNSYNVERQTKEKDIFEQAIKELEKEDIKNLNKIIENNSCDAIVTNPPYMKNNSGIKNDNEIKLISRHEIKCNIEDIVKVSSKLLKDNGELYMVHRPDRLVGIIEILRKYKIEPKKIRFVYSREGENSNLILIKAVKNSGEFLKIEKPLYIYNKNNKYTDEVLEIYNKK